MSFPRDKLTGGVNDTSGQFAAGVNNTAGDDETVDYFSAVFNDTDNQPCVAKLQKNSKGFKQEKLIHEKLDLMTQLAVKNFECQ